MNRCIQFGTDGIRGNAQQFPFTQPSLNMLAQAIGQWCTETYGPGAHILIGHDTRSSCTPIKRALLNGLCATENHCYDAHILPTPAVVALVKNSTSFKVGIIISASHNLAEDNGIKIVNHLGDKISRADEERINAIFESIADQKTPLINPQKRIIHNVSVTMQEKYINLVCSYFSSDFLRGRTIVLDCAQGATYEIAPLIFKQLGATVITLAAEPDGHNINKGCGSLHPNTLQKKVARSGADAGFAFDGDGDRVIAVNKQGLLLDGDDILALLLDHPVYAHTRHIVGTVMSNEGLARYVQSRGKTLVRTSVGDRHIIAYLMAHRLLLGGEVSGHIIAADYLPSGDGIFAALRVLESIGYRSNWQMNTFAKFPHVTINVPTTTRTNLEEEPYASIIAAHRAMLPQGRLVVRYSGTEPLLRIMAEDQNHQAAKTTAESLKEQLQSTLT